jgi:deoxyribose-phosphate aldolase
MKQTVGDRLEVKAAGGIHTKDDAMEMIANGATRLGASAGVKIIGKEN